MAARRRVEREGGQVLALFALSVTVLLAMSSLAIDVGRLLSQQRAMQNAADAAALAAAKTAVLLSGGGGGTVQQARQAADGIVRANLTHTAAGIAPFGAADPVVLGTPGDPRTLLDGIAFIGANGALLEASDPVSKVASIRVALQARVRFLIGGIVGVDGATARARAHVGLTAQGNMMPIAVRRYIGGTGPNPSPPATCPDPIEVRTAMFFDVAASEITACQGQVDASSPIAYGGRTPASAGQPGPPTQLVGQGAQANGGGISFRGFINLDVRRFTDASRAYYNGMSSGTSLNAAKDQETAWVAGGYPGPGFGSVALPPATPDPGHQVGIMDGNSAGQIVDAVKGRFAVGDVLLAAYYDGNVKTTPAFALSVSRSIPVLQAGTTASGGEISLLPDKQFTNWVNLQVWRLPAWLTGANLAQTVVQPPSAGSKIGFVNLQAAAGTPASLDVLWVKGSDTNQPNHLYAPDVYLPVPVEVGGVSARFGFLPTSPTLVPTAWGEEASVDISISRDTSTEFTGGVTVSLDATGGTVPDTLPATAYRFTDGAGRTGSSLTIPLSGTTVSNNGKKSKTTLTGTVRLTVSTSGLEQRDYKIPLVMTGRTRLGQEVRQVVIVKILPSPEATGAQNRTGSYVEIVGFGAFRITAEDANTIWGEAITPIRPSPEDPELLVALTPRLSPW